MRNMDSVYNFIKDQNNDKDPLVKRCGFFQSRKVIVGNEYCHINDLIKKLHEDVNDKKIDKSTASFAFKRIDYVNKQKSGVLSGVFSSRASRLKDLKNKINNLAPNDSHEKTSCKTVKSSVKTKATSDVSQKQAEAKETTRNKGSTTRELEAKVKEKDREGNPLLSEPKSKRYDPELDLLRYHELDSLLNELLQTEVDANEDSVSEMTPLPQALIVDEPDEIDINAKNNEGNTPLSQAIIEKNFGLAAELIDKGAALDIPNRFGIVPLLDVLLELQTSGSENVNSEKQKELALFLIDKGADPNPDLDAMDQRFRTEWLENGLLARMITPELKDITIALIKKGALLNTSNKVDLLLKAIQNKEIDPQLINVLIEHGADLNKQDSRGNAPIHAAIKAQRDSIANALIANGADLNLINANGDTPLHLANASCV